MLWLRLARIASHHGRLLGGLPDSLVLALFLANAHCHASIVHIRSSPSKVRSDHAWPRRSTPLCADRAHPCSRPCASSHSSPIDSAFLHATVECDSLADGRRQDLPTGEAENGMLLHLATMAPRERFEWDAGVAIAASDLFGRNRDGPNTSPATLSNRFTIL